MGKKAEFFTDIFQKPFGNNQCTTVHSSERNFSSNFLFSNMVKYGNIPMVMIQFLKILVGM